MDAIELLLRAEKGEELTWAEVDQNWSQLLAAVNFLLKSNRKIDFETVAAGELAVTHNQNAEPSGVKVWQLIPGVTPKWIPVATPDVYYKESEKLNKLYINFVDAPGTIKVFIEF